MASLCVQRGCVPEASSWSLARPWPVRPWSLWWPSCASRVSASLACVAGQKLEESQWEEGLCEERLCAPGPCGWAEAGGEPVGGEPIRLGAVRSWPVWLSRCASRDCVF